MGDSAFAALQSHQRELSALHIRVDELHGAVALLRDNYAKQDGLERRPAADVQGTRASDDAGLRVLWFVPVSQGGTVSWRRTADAGRSPAYLAQDLVHENARVSVRVSHAGRLAEAAKFLEDVCEHIVVVA